MTFDLDTRTQRRHMATVGVGRELFKTKRRRSERTAQYLAAHRWPVREIAAYMQLREDAVLRLLRGRRKGWRKPR